MNEQLISSLEKEYRLLRFRAFDAATAMSIAMRVVERVKKEFEKPVTIDVQLSGRQLFHYSMDGASPDNDEWVRRKARVALRFHKSSLHLAAMLQAQAKTIEERYGLDGREYAASGGAFPIIIESVGACGAIACSGLKQEDDHRLVAEAIAAELGIDYRSPV
jgi:uncharacterized protein (UPF0303 family)